MSEHETASPVEGARLVAPTLAPQEPRALSAPLSGIAALPASAMMRAEIARRAARGLGNAELQRMLRIRPRASSMLLRSPLSDELEALWNAQQKDQFFERIRGLKERDDDLEKFIRAGLHGDDRWRALNLLFHGPEANWPSGTLSIDQPAECAPDANGRYSFPVKITFVPDARVRATEIGFIQTTRWTERAGTVSIDPREGVAPRLTTDAWAIDRLHQRPQGWYGIEPNMPPKGATVELGSAQPPNPPVNATMRDEPQWNEPNVRIEFETAAVARAGPDAGKVYKVITWGFTVDGANKVTALRSAEADHESPAFQAAVAAWNAQATGPFKQKNHPGQRKLESLH